MFKLRSYMRLQFGPSSVFVVFSEGEARAVAEAILETVTEENEEAIAEAVAKVTGESQSTVLEELKGGDVNGIAEAVAVSTGGRASAYAEAASVVSKLDGMHLASQPCCCS